MYIKVNHIFMFNNQNFYKNGIDEDLYINTVFMAKKERGCKNKNLLKIKDNNFIYKNSLEIINSFENYRKSIQNNIIKNTKPSILYKDYRNNFSFTSTLQKQIFINNFLFVNNENFIDVLRKYNINSDKINNLIETIENKKMEVKNKKHKTKYDYILNIDGICNIGDICKYYNLKYPELIINKILELNYIYPNLIESLNQAKKYVK